MLEQEKDAQESVADSSEQHSQVIADSETAESDSSTEEATADAAEPIATATQAEQAGSGDAPQDTQPAEDEANKKKSPGLGPRWSYILTRGTVIALVWAFFAFAFDPLIRFGAITAGQNAVGAKVDVAHLSTTLFPPTVHISEVEVANAKKPGTNLVAFGSMTSDVDGMALLKGLYVVDKATVAGITWGTQRDDDGLLPGVDPAEEDESEADFGKLEDMGKQWAEGLLDRAKLEYDPRNLESVRLADQLEDEWKNDFEGLETRIKGIDAKYEQLEDLFKLAKGGNPLKKIDTYRKVAEEGTRLLRTVDTVRNELKRLPPKATVDLGDLNEARKRDQEEIKRKVNELVVDGEKLSEFLLGPELNHRVKNTLAWLQWTNRTVDQFKSDPKPERLRGEDVLFHREVELPKYLVRLIDVTGGGEIGGDELAIEGTIADVSSDPQLYGKPTIVRMSGRGDADVRMKAVLDRTTDMPENEIDLKYELSRPVSSRLGDEKSLIVEVQAESTEWTVRVRTEGEVLSGTILMTQKPVLLTAHLKEGTDDALQRILEASVKQIDKVEATVTLSGTIRKPRMKIRTNLGPAIANGVKQGLGNEVSAQKDALIAKFDSEMGARNNQLVEMFRGKYKDVFSQLDSRQTNIQSLIPKLGSKSGFDPTKLFR